MRNLFHPVTDRIYVVGVFAFGRAVFPRCARKNRTYIVVTYHEWLSNGGTAFVLSLNDNDSNRL
jgi:hypothetical protein